MRTLAVFAGIVVAAFMVLSAATGGTANADHCTTIWVFEVCSGPHDPQPEPSPSPTPSPSPSPTDDPSPSPSPSPTEDALSPPDHTTHDCSRNVTSELQDWIDAQPDGTTWDFTGRCYRIDGGLDLIDRHDLTLQAGTFKAGERGSVDQPDWLIRHSTGITFVGMTVEGTNFDGQSFTADRAREGQHNWEIHNGSSHVTLDGVTGRYAWGDFVAVQTTGDPDLTPVTDVTVRDSTFVASGRMGISTNHSERLTIEGNRLHDIAWSTIDLEVEHDTWSIRDVIIRGNSFGKRQHAAVIAWVPDLPVTDILIENNEATQQGDTCWPFVASRGGASKAHRRWTVRSNTSWVRQEGYTMIDGRDHAVEGNTLTEGTANCGIPSTGLRGDGSTGRYRDNVLHGVDRLGTGLDGWQVSGNQMR